MSSQRVCVGRFVLVALRSFSFIRSSKIGLKLAVLKHSSIFSLKFSYIALVLIRLLKPNLLSLALIVANCYSPGLSDISVGCQSACLYLFLSLMVIFNNSYIELN